MIQAEKWECGGGKHRKSRTTMRFFAPRRPAGAAGAEIPAPTKFRAPGGPVAADSPARRGNCQTVEPVELAKHTPPGTKKNR